MSAELLQRLTQHRVLSGVPPEQIAWIAKHGTLRHLQEGDVLTSKDRPVEGLHVVLDGHLSIHVDRGAGRRKIMEWHGGDVTGLMPFSRLVSPPADVVAEQPTDLVTVLRGDMPEMIRECFELTAALVHIMLDRARHFTSSFLHDEKLVSLGKLAAGLAHELNNPASAIARGAGSLALSMAEADTSSRRLGSMVLSAEQIAAIEQTRDACLASVSQSVLSPLQQDDRERDISAWLAARGVSPEPPESLAEVGLTVEALEKLAHALPPNALDCAISWVAASAATRRITAEIQEAAARIVHLVDAVKGFTQMDRESVSEPVDISLGLANTIAVLRSKAKEKSASLTLEMAEDLPRVNGFAGELNQVWANLISNALDAAGENGRVVVTAKREHGAVVVRVIDDGPGIPQEIRGRIFDPFFTTKPVGEGSGLGLDIVRRLVQRHNGLVELDSVSGRTEFRVILP
jgi:signal transduction histidine kinase